MIEVNIRGKLYQVHHNPWLTQYFNLTNQMLLIKHLPEMAAKLKEQAEGANKIYDEEQKRLKIERQKLQAERISEERRQKAAMRPRHLPWSY